MAETLLVEPDVESARRIVELLDDAGLPPKAALWVYSSESDRWRFWIVPSEQAVDKREFYRTLSILISNNQQEIGVDIGSVQLVKADDPAIRELKKVIRVDGISRIRFTDNMLNGVFLPDVVILRMAV